MSLHWGFTSNLAQRTRREERETDSALASEPSSRPTPSYRLNPAPLGLGAFALTVFMLSMVNLGTLNIQNPNITLGPAYAYGGLTQLLAGMWSVGIGDTFQGTLSSSFGAFWLSFAITLTPGGFQIERSYGSPDDGDFNRAFGLFLIAWFIFTFLLWLATFKSNLALCSLLWSVWMTFLLLGIAYIRTTDGQTAQPVMSLIRAGGAFGLIAGFLAWYLMLAGLLDKTNSFIMLPLGAFSSSDATATS